VIGIDISSKRCKKAKSKTIETEMESVSLSRRKLLGMREEQEFHEPATAVLGSLGAEVTASEAARTSSLPPPPANFSTSLSILELGYDAHASLDIDTERDF